MQKTDNEIKVVGVNYTLLDMWCDVARWQGQHNKWYREYFIQKEGYEYD